ncbi:MAG: hypothetical protein KatS3mg105_5148 [Gemmatales bacterium]|nr:MAG: hypothetical protein KatS3mg105_5148 [Gemmatales bacterium]GIW97841.1 MAG: hypothetical protein KatS3mg111_1174 [Pirellulaceae bacterium]
MEPHIPDHVLIHIVARHACKENEPWERIVPKECVRVYREADCEWQNEIERSHGCSDYEAWCRLVPRAFRQPLKAALIEQVRMGQDRPMYIESTEPSRCRRSRSRSIIGPAGLLLFTKVFYRKTHAKQPSQRLSTAYFVVHKYQRATWRTAARRLLNRYCRCKVTKGFVVPSPDDIKGYTGDIKGEKRRVEAYEIEVNTPETFGISRERVIRPSRHTFPNWPEARKWETVLNGLSQILLCCHRVVAAAPTPHLPHDWVSLVSGS